MPPGKITCVPPRRTAPLCSYPTLPNSLPYHDDLADLIGGLSVDDPKRKVLLDELEELELYLENLGSHLRKIPSPKPALTPPPAYSAAPPPPPAPLDLQAQLDLAIVSQSDRHPDLDHARHNTASSAQRRTAEPHGIRRGGHRKIRQSLASKAVWEKVERTRAKRAKRQKWARNPVMCVVWHTGRGIYKAPGSVYRLTMGLASIHFQKKLNSRRNRLALMHLRSPTPPPEPASKSSSSSISSPQIVKNKDTGMGARLVRVPATMAAFGKLSALRVWREVKAVKELICHKEEDWDI